MGVCERAIRAMGCYSSYGVRRALYLHGTIYCVYLTLISSYIAMWRVGGKEFEENESER